MDDQLSKLAKMTVQRWLVVGLLLASFGMFIALVDGVAVLQINSMLTFTGAHGRSMIEPTYPPLGADCECISGRIPEHPQLPRRSIKLGKAGSGSGAGHERNTAAGGSGAELGRLYHPSCLS